MEVYAFAGYGAGNLGDDAIFEGLKKTYSSAIQVYSNIPSSFPSVWYSEIVEHGFPESAEGGTLIIGGGGIFHSKYAVEEFILVVKKARQRNMKVVINKVGAEGLNYEFFKESKQLCESVEFISVRSNKSKQILESSLNVPVDAVEKDFTYALVPKPDDAVIPRFGNEEIPTIGLVTAGNKDDLDKIARIIKFVITDHGFGDIKCNILHIPHTRHYTDRFTNDVVTGEMLWSMVDIYHDKRHEKFKLLPFTGDPIKLIGTYGRVSGIIGLRYHSFIFSELNNTPVLGLVSGSKAQTYFDETERDKEYCRHIDIGSPMEEILKAVFDFLTKIKKLDNKDFYEYKTLAGGSRVEYLLKELK